MTLNPGTTTTVRKIAVATASFTAAALLLAGCSGGDGDATPGDDGGGAEAATGGLFTSTTDAADSYMVLIDGDAITLVDVDDGRDSCEDNVAVAFEDGSNSDFSDDSDAYELVDTGTLNDSRSMAVWDEEGSAPVSIESDTVVLDNTFNASNSYDEISFTTAGSAEDVAGLMCG